MMSYDLEADAALPGPLRATRVLLFFGAAITALLVVSALLMAGASAELIGRLVWMSWPGAAAFVIALRLQRRGKGLFWATVVVSGFWILSALAALGQGNPRGFTQLAIPVAILVLVTRPASRDYLVRG
jgi:hypothetical protein